jgi:hypothetical protein
MNRENWIKYAKNSWKSIIDESPKITPLATIASADCSKNKWTDNLKSNLMGLNRVIGELKMPLSEIAQLLEIPYTTDGAVQLHVQQTIFAQYKKALTELPRGQDVISGQVYALRFAVSEEPLINVTKDSLYVQQEKAGVRPSARVDLNQRRVGNSRS